MNSVYYRMLIVSLGLLLGCNSPSKSKTIRSVNKQENRMDEYTPEIERQIQQSISDEAKQLKLKLRKKSLSKERIEFMVDTFKIVALRSKKMNYLYSTQEMNELVNEELVQYDRLMNKFYNKLYAQLEISDKAILKNAQKAWLDFRDKEITLYSILRDKKYSGGGTIQSNIFTGLRCDLTRQRMNELFDHSCLENDLN